MMQDVKFLTTSLLNTNESVVITQDFVDKVKFLENLIRMNTNENDKIVEDMDFVLQKIDLNNHIGQSPKDVWKSLKNY